VIFFIMARSGELLLYRPVAQGRFVMLADEFGFRAFSPDSLRAWDYWFHLLVSARGMAELTAIGGM